MKVFLKSILFLLFISMPQPIIADTTEVDSLSREEAISRVMDLSGLNIQVPQFADYFIESFHELLLQIPEKAREEASNIVTLAFDEIRMLEIVKAEVTKSVSLKEAITMLEWYMSKDGIYLTSIEESPIDISDIKTMTEQKNELFANKDRVTLMEKLAKQAHTIDIQLEVEINIVKSILKIEKNKMGKAETEEYLQKIRYTLEPQIKESTILTNLYVYKSVEEDILREYLDFLSKMSTQAFIKSSNNGISKAIQKSVDEMLHKLKIFGEEFQAK